MKVALDTNILAYAEGVNGEARQREARTLLGALPVEAVIIPAQALGELFAVLVRKAGRDAALAREAVLSWRDAFQIQATSESVLSSAMDLAADHGMSWWDSVIMAAAAEAGCRMLLTEDLQHGFTWRGLTVVDPFRRPAHPLLSTVVSA